MNLFTSSISDVQKVWNNVRSIQDRSLARVGGASSSTSDSFGFITPSIVALGRYSEKSLADLVDSLGSRRALMWNLSGKPVLSSAITKLDYQLMDVPWSTPGEFTQAPVLESIFAQIYAIKAWLDLSTNHVVIVHCVNGRSRSGILVGALLKYIGAFTTSNSAFEFFCSTRFAREAVPKLNPSYNILFENIDQAINLGGYPNTSQMHLKCISISNLPLEDIPCVEIWDQTGMVYCSHTGSVQSDKCTWAAGYGDGFYRVGIDILGDFSLMCRFGGSHVAVRDKTTLIFRYQNSTAFLPNDVIELKKSNVDVNPEYADSFDHELFTVHMMFQSPWGAKDKPTASARLLFPIYTYPEHGKEAFRCGIDEISKHHVLEPDPSKFSEITADDVGEEALSTYTPVALQLSANSVQEAVMLVKLMKRREEEVAGKALATTASTVTKSSDSSIEITPSASAASVSGPRARDHLMNAVEVMQEGAEAEELERKSLSGSGNAGGSSATSSANASAPGEGVVLDSNTCAACFSSEYSKRDQLLHCSECNYFYHTGCTGTRKIPFTIKTHRERESRDKYIKKYFPQWKCPNCTQRLLALSGSDSNGAEGEPVAVESSGHMSSFESTSSFTGRDGIIREGLFSGLPDPSPLAIPSLPKVERSVHSLRVEGPITTETVQSESIHTPSSTPSAPQNVSNSPTDAYITTSTGAAPSSAAPAAASADSSLLEASKLLNMLMSAGISLDALALMSNEDRTKALAQAMSSTPSSAPAPATAPAVATSGEPSSVVYTKTAPTGASSPAGVMSDADVEKYKKMVQMGLSASSIIACMSKDGVDPSQFSRVLSPEEITAVSTGTAVASNPPPPEALVDAKYYKYLNLVRAGIPKGPVAAKMVTEGVCTSKEEALEVLNTSTTIPGETANQWYSTSKMPSNSSGTVSTAEAPALSVPPSSSMSAASSGEVAVAYKDHPQYAKYFKMIKAGLPEISVKAKMQQEGIDPSILKRDASEVIMVPASLVPALTSVPTAQREEPSRPTESAAPIPPIASDGAGANVSQKDSAKPDEPPAPPAVETQSLASDPKYGKYFKLLKMGMPREGIEMKMRAEGLDPSVLDKSPSDPAPGATPAPSEQASEASGSETVAVQDHPKYSKFFKMLKVGLPKSMVKTKVEQEGLDPSYIDKDPQEKVPLNDSPAADDAGGEKVAAQDHPKYSKFFKMLKVGLPKSMVKTKVEQEGLDPNVIDKDPEEKIPLNDEVKETVAVQDHPKYSKFFKMLKVGLPKSMVKTKVEQEGLDPSYIDKDPEEKVPLDDSSPKTPVKAPSPKKTPSPVKKAPLVRKKKLHWKAIESVSADSVWATGNDEDDDMFKLDKEEFDELFTDKGDEKTKAAPVAAPKLKKATVVNLIDGKRGQNAGIALARIKMTYSELRNRIQSFNASGLSTDQLRSLDEFLPNEEDKRSLTAYKGDLELLGKAEQYMLEMLRLPDASKRIKCMIFQQLFQNRVTDIRGNLDKISEACNDVKISDRFRKVLKAILKVGNELNDGANQAAFTLDSLLKLPTAKAFDKKTSVLQYIVTVISRSDPGILMFPEELVHVSPASRIVMDQLTAEFTMLRNELDGSIRVVETCPRVVVAEGNNASEAEGLTEAAGIRDILSFLESARRQCETLEKSMNDTKTKYGSVLNYFAADPNMPSHDFFSILSTFIQSFIETRETVERLRKAEEKRAQIKKNEELAAAAGTPVAIKRSHVPMRRGSVHAIGGTPSAAATPGADGEANPPSVAAAGEAVGAAATDSLTSPAPLPSRKPMRRASAFS